MTHEQNLKTIKEACWASNPEILELKFGCRVKHKIGIDEMVWYVYPQNPDGSQSFWTDLGRDRKMNHLYEILGRDIRLADVLYALDRDLKKPQGFHEYVFCLDGFICKISDYYKLPPVGCWWDIKQDSLDLQSPETIAFIASLLTNSK